MKNLTDLFIRRPVLARDQPADLVLGLRSLAGPVVNEYPQTQECRSDRQHHYYGAEAERWRVSSLSRWKRRSRRRRHRLPVVQQLHGQS